MNEPEPDEDQPVQQWRLSTRHWAMFVVTLLVCCLCGLAVTVFAMIPLAFAQDICFGQPWHLICDNAALHVVMLIPWGGLVAAILVSLVVAGLAVRRHQTPFVGIGVGIGVDFIALLTTYTIAS